MTNKLTLLSDQMPPMKPFRKIERPLKCFPNCPFCDGKGTATRRRMNTAYVNEKENWITCCDDAYEDTLEYYQDLRNEYYANCM